MDYDPDRDIPDLTGRVIIVTGGAGGLGRESVRQLSKHNPAKIYLAARSREKYDAAVVQITEAINAENHSSLDSSGKEVKETSSGRICPIEYLELDLTSFASIKKAAASFLTRESRLDILLANAGIMGSKGTTKDGFEITMGVNHLGHALLIRLLLPTMIETAKLADVPKGSVRVVSLASEAEGFGPKEYPFEKLRGPQSSAWMMTKYAQSKLANVQYVKELVRRYPEETSGVRFVSVHPGRVETDISREILKSPLVKKIMKTFLWGAMGAVTVEVGAWNQLWACTAGSVSGTKGPVNGEFYYPVAVGGKASRRACDKEMGGKLWEWTEGIVGPELKSF